MSTTMAATMGTDSVPVESTDVMCEKLPSPKKGQSAAVGIKWETIITACFASWSRHELHGAVGLRDTEG